MTLVGRIKDPRLAQAFVDYMAVQGVQCQLHPTDEGVGVLCAESDIEQVRNEFVRFAEDPLHKRYRSASWQRTDSSKTQFDYGASGFPLLHQIWVQAGPITLITLIACLALGVTSFIGLGNWLFSWLHFPAPFEIQWIELWRFWTPALMHGDMVHLLFNLVIWWYLGSKIESGVGSAKLLLLLLVGAFIPNLWQGLWVGPAFLGLSGVNYALIGYLALTHKAKPEMAIPPALIGFMLFWMALGFVMDPTAWVTGDSGGMANLAHLGGLLVGLAQGAMDRRQLTTQ